MNPAYQHLTVANLQPGMVLSDEILDAQGHVLLPQGAILTERTIAHFPAHGIDVVAVLCAASAVDAAPPSANAEQTLARINHLFRKNDPDDADDWATGILRRYMTDYRLDREVEQ